MAFLRKAASLASAPSPTHAATFVPRLVPLLASALLLLPATPVWAQQEFEVTSWTMQDSALVGPAAGTAIATGAFEASSWYTATVPGTVLTTLVDRGVYPDPYYGENMLTPTNGGSIPDLAGEQRRYWFRGSFPPVTLPAGGRAWLEFGGINYKAWIYCNGVFLDTMFGAFKERKFDITGLVGSSPTGTNYIAVKIRGNFNPGIEHGKQSGSCGPNGGTMSQDGPTFIASQGWDWIPTIPDRDMGIWKPVCVRITGPVALRHPWNRTVGVSATSATDSLQVTLINGSGFPVAGTVAADLDGTLRFASQAVTVPADSLVVTFPALTIANPRLWMPNGYGDPNLYALHLSFTPQGASTPSDTLLLHIGVRQFTYATSPSLTIACNGQRILCRGGNWGMDDAMKRWNLHRLEAKIRYHREMHFNMIRDWVGQTDCEPFYDLCDRYGIMVWSDFWEPYSSDAPQPVADQANYIATMRDKLLRTRNHACIAIWCGRNESAATPAFIGALNSFHAALDGTRTVLDNSGSGPVHSGGPYTWTAIADCYAKITGFHTEFGSPHLMTYESMQATFPVANLMPMGNAWWSFHDYCSGAGSPANYTGAMTATWGPPAGTNTLYDCTKKAQLMNYDEARATEEALSAKRFNGVTGMLLWMSNCAWPSLVWQTYDYYLEGTGGFFGFRKGAEPVHAMYYGGPSCRVSVVNNTVDALSGYSLTAATYNLDGGRAWTATAAVNVAADGIADIMPVTAGASAPYFLDLKLRDASGGLVSHNFYWEPANGSDLGAMLDSTRLAMVSLAQPAPATWIRIGGENALSFMVVNPATNPVPAVFARLKLTVDSAMGARILPAHWSENYFSLLPGDTQVVTVTFDEADRLIGGALKAPVLSLSGINVRPMTLALGAMGISRRGDDENSRQAGFYAGFIGGKLRLHNLPAGSGWRVEVFDLRGRLVRAESGPGGRAAVVSLARLRPGAYVASARAGQAKVRSIVIVGKQ